MSPQVLTKRKRSRARAPRRNFLRLHRAVLAAAESAATLEAALQAALELVCAHAGWPVGHAYVRPDAADAWASSTIWSFASPTRFRAFRKAMEALSVPADAGLPGRVLATGQPAWTTNVASDRDFPCGRAAAACGLRAAFAFPVLSHAEVVGVLEFFSTAADPPDEPLLEVMASAGAALGWVFERVRAGTQLWESVHFASTVLASVKEGVIVYDRQLRYRVWNKFMEDLTGVSATQVLGARALDVFPHLAEQGIDKILGRALAGETVESPDTPYRVPATGKTGWVVGQYGPLLSAHGHIIGVVATVREITERRLVEERQRKSEERFRALIEHSSDAIALVDAAGTFLYLSPASARISGHAPHEVLGQNALDLVHPDDRGTARAALDDLARRNAAATRVRLRLRHKNGTWRWIDATATNLLAEAAVTAIVMNYRDVTEGKEAVDEIRERAELMARFVNLSETLNEPLTVAEVARAIGQAALALSRADRAAVFLTRPPDQAVCAWSQGFSDEYVRMVEAGRGDPILSCLLRGDDPPVAAFVGAAGSRGFLVPDIAEQPPDTVTHRLAVAHGYRALGAWPLLYKGRIVGIVGCYFDAPRTWSGPEQEIFQALCWEAAGALENAGLYEGKARKTAELEALFNLSKQLRVAPGVEEMYPIIVERAKFLLGANTGSLALLDRDRETFTRVYSVGLPDAPSGSTFPVTGSRSGAVARRGMPYVTEDFGTDKFALYSGAARRKIGPAAIVPVRSEQETIGTLALSRPPDGSAPPFTEAEVRILEGIAEIGGTAIQRARLQQNLEEAYLQMVVALAGAVDARDSYTSDHSERIAAWAEAVAQAMGCGDDDVKDIRRAARLHDIGKIGIPDSILLKPMGLTDGEWAVMRRHPLIGAEILMSVQRMRGVAKLVRHHQERWDGTGYPDALMGEEIPLGARILAVVDAYSAITDDRPYKPARSHDEAIAELERCAGAQFDPRVVDVFRQTVRDLSGRPAGPPQGKGQ